jgi:hypothetical protein
MRLEALIKLITRSASYKYSYVRIKERAAGRSWAISFKNLVELCQTIVHPLAEVGIFRRYRIG